MHVMKYFILEAKTTIWTKWTQPMHPYASLILGISAIEVKISSNPVPVGETVTLEPIPQMDINIGTWSYETQAILFASKGDVQLTGYRDKILFDNKTWALSLQNVTLADAGSYILQGFQPLFTAKATLYVLGK